MSDVEAVTTGGGAPSMVSSFVSRLAAWPRSAWAALSGNPRSTASTGFVAVAAVSVLVAMFLADGFRATSYDLRDSGVWVVNESQHKFGRINTQIGEQDGVRSVTGEVAVVQDGHDVFVRDADAWKRVDPAGLGTGDALDIPAGSHVDLAGGTMAVMDPEGRVWTTGAADAEQLKTAAPGGAGDQGAPESESPSDGSLGADIDAGPGARLAVARTGDVIIASPELERVIVLPAGEGAQREIPMAIDGLPDLQVSAVAGEPVVLAGTSLVLPTGRTVEVTAAGARLQLPGDEAEHVLVATDEGLLGYPLDGGEPSRVDGDEVTPGMTRPVHIAGCTYAAWGGPSASVLHRCGDERRVLPMSGASGGEPVLPDDARLEFKVNRAHVALNELSQGLVLVVVDGDLIQADHWDETEDDQKDKEKEKSDDKVRQLEFDPDENQPPEVEDDRAGARAGLPTIVAVLDNDVDPNSDVLTVDELPAEVEGATVQLVQGGQAVQVTPTKESGTVSFTYRAFDGALRSERAATVTVTIYDASVQTAPQPKKYRDPSLTVGARSVGTYEVLEDWYDPEGDPIVLESATVDPAAGAQVSAQSDGLLTYVDEAGRPATNQVALVVTDAPLLVGVQPLPNADRSLPVTVTNDSVNSPPVARNDFATTVEEQPVVIWPMRNDSDPDGDRLSFELLPKDELPEGILDNGDGSVTVTPPALAGGATSILFGYELSDGTSTHQARVRVDALPKTSAAPPSAAMDLVVLPAPPASGRSAAERTVDLLSNDFSPSGAVLVVTGIERGERAPDGLEIQLIEHRRLRVSYEGRLERPVQMTYSLSDGVNVATGTVVVMSTRSEGDLPPLAIDDVVAVRAGDIVNVPVLANDIDPEGAPLFLAPELAQGPAAGEGLAFVSGQRVRFIAPDEPMELRLTYLVSDGSDPLTSHSVPGEIRISVRSGEGNRPPTPLPVEARVLAGSKVKITVPLTGVDPDGDSVRLLGLGMSGGTPHAPRLGRITEVGLDYLVYEAFDQQGTDEFRYGVVDTGGPSGNPLPAEGVIRVGVAGGTGVNQPPAALVDHVTIRPGTTLEVDPLANDFDPDGDDIDLAAKEPLSGATPGLDAAVDSGRVRLTVPDGQQSYSVGYAIEDIFDDRDTSVIHVSAVDDAPGVPPIARDDLAEVRPDQQSVTVAVLDNDEDPDGDPAQLEVSTLSGFPGAPSPDARRLVVSLTGRSQVVPYRITDEQGLSATAVVRVPPAGDELDLMPVLRDKAPKLVVTDGQPITIELADHVVDPEGAPVRFGSSRVASVNGRAEVLSPTSLRFSDPTIEHGSASVTVIVTDAPEGSEGNAAVLTLPVTIRTTRNQPPVWRTTREVLVSVDDSEVFEVDLEQLVDDIEKDSLTFARIDGPDGVDVSPDGRLTARAATDLIDKVGQSLTPALRLTVSDGQNPPVETVFPVKVRHTAKPPPTVRTFSELAEAGKPRTVNVLEGAFNPFAEEDAPLRIVGGSASAAPSHGSVSATTDEITFTPGSDFVGTAVVTYRVEDKVGRAVPGTVTFTVRATPGRPGQPTVAQVSASSVEVRWSAASANGSAIEEYTVISSAGSTKGCGTALSCVVTGLRPGDQYTFTVVARNELGEGDPSPSSAPIRPDECAGPPRNVQLVFDAGTNPPGGRQLVARWEPPENSGTPVEGYEVEVQPSGQTIRNLRDTSITLAGLENGTGHDVTVRAVNRCEVRLGAPGLSTDDAVPAGVPDAPTVVQANRVDDRAGGRVLVSWVAPAEGGDPNDHGDRVTTYTITEVNGLREATTVDAGSLGSAGSGRVEQELSVAKNGGPYQFVIVAHNKAGASEPSGPSGLVTAESAPSEVRAVTAVVNEGVTGFDGRARLDFAPPTDDGGAPVKYFEYRIGANGSWTRLSADRFVGGLQNGSAYTFFVRAHNGTFPGNESPPSPSVVPYGPLPPPRITAHPSSNQVTFTWEPSGPTRGSTIQVSVLSESASGSRDGGTGSVTVGGAYSSSYWLTVTYRDEYGQTSSHRERGTTGSAPLPAPPTATDLIVVVNGGRHVGVAFNAHWDDSRGGITCQFFMDNAPISGVHQCGVRPSMQFYDIAAGSHTFWARVTDAFGQSAESNRVTRATT